MLAHFDPFGLLICQRYILFLGKMLKLDELGQGIDELGWKIIMGYKVRNKYLDFWEQICISEKIKEDECLDFLG